MARFNNGGIENLWQIFKAHKNEKFLKAIDSCKDESDIKYLRNDMATGKAQFKTIRDRIEKCSNGKNIENSKYYDGIEKLYLKHGVTTKDVDLTIEWFDTVARKALKDKASEIKKK